MLIPSSQNSLVDGVLAMSDTLDFDHGLLACAVNDAGQVKEGSLCGFLFGDSAFKDEFAVCRDF